MDRLTEMEAFATVVDQGGFTDAARKMGISKSAVSKHVSALETRLGARLLNRTTRRVSPTDIGLAYYDRARRLLSDAGEADALVATMQAVPSGLLRISVARELGSHHLSTCVGQFLQAYPEVTLSMELSNRYVELVSEGFDMAVRVGDPGDGQLGQRRLAETAMRMVASPDYLRRHGHPERIEDLNNHRLLHHADRSGGAAWQVRMPSGEVREVRNNGGLAINDGQSLLNAAIAGLGIAHLPSFLYADALAQGLVEEAMPDLPLEVRGIHAVFPQGRFTQPKMRVFLEFLERTFDGRGALDW